MINVFNSPIEASSIDEFHKDKKEQGDETVFDNTRKRPKVSYNADGRKVVDGVVEDEKAPNLLWTTTISRGVANEWREKAEGNRLTRARRYVESLSYDCRLFVNRHATPLLLLVNVSLILVVLYLFNILFW